jgi:hypothetical protein
MSDFRDYDYRDPNDPLRRDPPLDLNTSAMNATWGWIAAAVFLVVVLAVAFGTGHQPYQITASNDVAPPAVTHMAPPTMAPAPGPVTTTAQPPITPAPAAPAPNGNSQ